MTFFKDMRRLGKRKYDRRLPLPRPSEILPPGRFTTLRDGDGWASEVAESDLIEPLTCPEPREEALGLGPCDPCLHWSSHPLPGNQSAAQGEHQFFFHFPFSSCCHFDCLSPQTLLRHRDLPWIEAGLHRCCCSGGAHSPGSGHRASDHVEIRTTCPQKCDRGFPWASSASCLLAEPKESHPAQQLHPLPTHCSAAQISTNTRAISDSPFRP